jgi:hypothetical protein
MKPCIPKTPYSIRGQIVDKTTQHVAEDGRGKKPPRPLAYRCAARVNKIWCWVDGRHINRMESDAARCSSGALGAQGESHENICS